MPDVVDLHPLEQCAWCGAREALRITTLRATLAPAAVCADMLACLRRQRVRRRLAA